MQNQLILPSKRRVDIHGILVPFDQLLLPGEVLVEGTCTVKVLTGIDPDPSHMLDGDVQVRGTNLYQQIKLGVPGVIYSITFEGTTDLENTYTVETKQAVLEDQIPAGPIYQNFFFTSTVYPLETLEGLASSADVNDAYIIQITIEGIDSLVAVKSAELRDLVVGTTMSTDGIESLVGVVSATLVDIVKSTTMPTDGIVSSASVGSATLVNRLITYSNWPAEGIVGTVSVKSGTLV